MCNSNHSIIIISSCKGILINIPARPDVSQSVCARMHSYENSLFRQLKLKTTVTEHWLIRPLLRLEVGRTMLENVWGLGLGLHQIFCLRVEKALLLLVTSTRTLFYSNIPLKCDSEPAWTMPGLWNKSRYGMVIMFSQQTLGRVWVIVR